MKKNTDSTINEGSISRIAGINEGLATIGAPSPIGVIASFFPAGPSMELFPTNTAAGASIITYGECSVACATQLAAGDWFTSDAEGLAVKTETGFALGRILADPVDGISLAVIGAVNL